MSTYVIRDADATDRPSVDRITRLAYQEFSRVMAPSAWTALASAVDAVLTDSGSAQCIVAEEGGRIVGSVFLYPGGSAAYGDRAVVSAPEFRLLAVTPDARRKGVGHALVQECIRRARDAGASELGLHSSRSFRQAIAMYVSMGFVRAPDRDFRPEGAEVIEGYRLMI